MDIPACEVIVREVPATLDSRKAKAFVRELASDIARVVRPCVVLDCARVHRVDGEFLHLLLCSLEEAMKRNGDVRLSGLPEIAGPALESMSMDRLFRVYPTAAQAAESFRRPGSLETAFAPAQGGTVQPAARAA